MDRGQLPVKYPGKRCRTEQMDVLKFGSALYILGSAAGQQRIAEIRFDPLKDAATILPEIDIYSVYFGCTFRHLCIQESGVSSLILPFLDSRTEKL